MKRPVAIFGADGYVGRHLAEALEGPIRFRRSDLDWSSGAPELRPTGLSSASCVGAILAAGVSRIAACELEPRETRRVNVDATVHLAGELTSRGIHVIAFSSDYVFDGEDAPYSDDAPARPVNEYGAQKAALERRLEGLADVLVLRLGKVYGDVAGDGTLLDEIRTLLRAGRPVRAAHDQRFNPVSVHDLVEAVLALQRSRATGLVNVCGSEAWTRLDLAREVAMASNAPMDLIQEISLDDLGEPFRRPKDTRMTADRLASLTGLRPPGPRRALDEAIAS